MSDILPIVMPKWGLAMSEGTLVSWLVPEGGEVNKGDEIAEIETTKITNAFASPNSGVLRRQIVKVGEIAPVGALLAIVAPTTVTNDEIDAFVGSFVVEVKDEGASGAVEREANFAGKKLFYKLAGGSQDGIPVVLIHGFGGDADNWLFNIDALSADRPVYAIDLPGHGKSTKDIASGDLGELADAVAAVVNDAGISKAHFVGHSLGAAVVFKMLEQHPDRVASIVGVAPAGVGPSVNDAYVSGFIAAEKRKDVKSSLQMLVADPEQVSAAMIEGIQRYKRLEGVAKAIQTIAAKTLPGGRQTSSFRDLLEKTNKPILIVWGEKDAIIDAAQAEGLSGKISIIRLPGVGHMPHLEAANTFNDRLIEQFKNVEANIR
ncbi:acetoin dehydrogenase dihydrolipoyllysine-residue acetyltransferase subunit [Hyphomicrobium sp.]|uniref:acetoin dehydrogenase dihydrolipoyllysine-residue acetyltransferase subunit n=1 Tax=Hyphomicrobium sp. TaxID=82 RepID=UPI000FA8A2EA|nr:acetoin dehydrogenase dihydrolipoyllysine-residue acetyltransferase subunit [Hyphomicrobium sp.]RUP08851.1 MAG: acetoin dehydrogenase dihydrolipoyllysine-residue acetyltransferase subunit [Hyphomicrobium sp.]